MTAARLAWRLQAAVLVLFVVVAEEKKTELTQNVVVTRLRNGDEFTNQGNCQSNWCTEHGGFCRGGESCCHCKCGFGQTYFLENGTCLRDTSFLLDHREGCKFKINSCDKTTTLKTVDLRSSGDKIVELCDEDLKLKTGQIYDCEVNENSTLRYKNGKWQYLHPGTGIEDTFSLNTESNAKIILEWEANTKLSGLLLLVTAKCQISKPTANSVRFDSCLVFKTAGSYSVTSPNPRSEAPKTPNTGRSSSSTTAAIICSLVAVVILCIVLLFFLYRWRKRNINKSEQSDVENIGNPSYEKGEETSIHFSPHPVSSERHSNNIDINTEDNYQSLMNGKSTAAPAKKPHEYQSLNKTNSKRSNPPQTLAFSQPEYASLEKFGPSKKEPVHSYQPLEKAKKSEQMADDENNPEYQEIPEYQDIDSRKLKDNRNSTVKDQSFKTKMLTTKEPMIERKDSEEDENYICDNSINSAPCRSGSDNQAAYRVLEGPGTDADQTGTENEHEYLDLLPQSSP